MKKVLSLVIAMCMFFSLSSTAFAVDVGKSEAEPTAVANVLRASYYLDGYSVGLGAKGSGLMAVAMTVDGVGVMDKIGVREIYIEQKIDGVWKFYDSLDGAEHPEFYDYNSRDYIGTTYFTGTPGVTYRVTLTAYAKKGTGSDTGYITSPTVVCK